MDASRLVEAQQTQLRAAIRPHLRGMRKSPVSLELV